MKHVWIGIFLFSCGQVPWDSEFVEDGMPCSEYPAGQFSPDDPNILYYCNGKLQLPGCEAGQFTDQDVRLPAFAKNDKQVVACVDAHMSIYAIRQGYLKWTLIECVSTLSGPGGKPNNASDSACFPDVTDNACQSCAKNACCDAYVACVGSSECWCWVECVRDKTSTFDTCSTKCGQPTDVTWTAYYCASGSCAAPCTMCQ